MDLKNERLHSSTNVTIDEHGDLRVDNYDFSDSAHSWLGHDVGYIVIVDKRKKLLMLNKLSKESFKDSNEDTDKILLNTIVERFGSYSEILSWLNSNAIGYEEIYNPWA